VNIVGSSLGALNLAARSRFYERVAPVNTLAGALAYRRAPGGPGDSTHEVGLEDHTASASAGSPPRSPDLGLRTSFGRESEADPEERSASGADALPN
jgi:hypothetical protein